MVKVNVQGGTLRQEEIYAPIVIAEGKGEGT